MDDGLGLKQLAREWPFFSIVLLICFEYSRSGRSCCTDDTNTFLFDLAASYTFNLNINIVDYHGHRFKKFAYTAHILPF